MEPVLHRSATAKRRLVERYNIGQESMRSLSLRHGINPKTVEQEAVVVAFPQPHAEAENPP
jgi:hypothetical protein